ncbi:MAG: hypothetical protein ACFFD9_06855 [Candidatus Thorarchaeota archaeon]
MAQLVGRVPESHFKTLVEIRGHYRSKHLHGGVQSKLWVDAMGVFGNVADVIIDLNLVIQWIIFVILVLGYIKRQELVTHGRLMVVATLVNLITVLLVMGRH